MFAFTDAFIFRRTSNFTEVAVYNLGIFISLPIFFAVNGLLLKKFDIRKIFFVGLLGQGFTTSLLFFFPTATLVALFFIACLQGMFMGFYWANRNFITIALTKDEHRNYFNGLLYTIRTLAGVIAPFFFGWFIFLGSSLHISSFRLSYQILAICIIALQFFAGLVFQTAQVENPKVRNVILLHPSPKWILTRFATTFLGIEDGVAYFLPALIALTFLGKENALGTMQSVAALVVAVALYIFGRVANSKHRLDVIRFAVVLIIVTASFFSLFFSAAMAIIYLIGISTTDNFMWLGFDLISMKVTEDENGGNLLNNYAHIADRELFLNIGRIIGISVFFMLIQFFSQQISLRFTPLAVALCEVLLLFFVTKLCENRKQH